MTLLDFAKKHGYTAVSVGVNSYNVTDGERTFFYSANVHTAYKCWGGMGETAAEAIKNAHIDARADRAAQAVRNKLRVVK